MSVEPPDARIGDVGASADDPVANSYNSRSSWVGFVAAGLAALCVLLEVAAISVGDVGHWAVATWLGYGVIGLTAVGFLAGLAAAILRRGGTWGVVAMVVCVLANPLVQIAVLGVFGNS